MGPDLLASELMKKKSGETNERKLNTEGYLVPRVTNPTQQTACMAKPKVARNSCRVLLIPGLEFGQFEGKASWP